jgi:hypothetical protein
MDDDTTIPSTLPEQDMPRKAAPDSSIHPVFKILVVGALLLVALWVFKR